MLDEIKKLSAFRRFVMIKSLGGGGVEYCNSKTKAIKSKAKQLLLPGMGAESSNSFNTKVKLQ